MPGSLPSNLDCTDVTLVRPDCRVNGRSADAYPVLCERQRTRVETALRGQFSDAAVDAVLGALWDWKRTSYANHARTHERLFGRTLDVSAPERNGDLVARAPRGEEGRVAACLHELGQSFLARHFGDALRVYRGIDIAVPGVVADLLDVPDRSTHSFRNRPTLLNVTTDRVVARDYGFLTVETDVPRSAVALAPDFTVPLVRDGEIRKRDAELRVRGDRIRRVDADRVRLPSTGKSLPAAFRSPWRLSAAEHRDVFDVVVRMQEQDGSVTTPAGEGSLRRWLRAFRRFVGFDGRNRVVVATRAVEDVVS